MLSSLLFCSAMLSQKPAEVPLRGVWLTTTANTAISTPAKTAETMAKLKEIGFNTVYVETWKNGYTQFPSAVLQKTIGVDRHPGLKNGRDLLGESLKEARKNGLKYIAWFEYGFMAGMDGGKNTLTSKYPQWMTTTREGKLVSTQNEFIWMNPLRPECQTFLLDMIKEAVQKYDLDGIQLDDRIAWPTSMGYDSYTKEIYAKEHNGAVPPDDSQDPTWVAWRANKVTKFAKKLHDELRKLKPDLIISISPAIYPWSLENYACNWPLWQKNGWMDEYVPQVYRTSHRAFRTEWKKQIAANPGAGKRLAAGIMIDPGGAPVPWEVIKQNLDLVKETNSGHVFWFSRGVLDNYSEQIKAYYGQNHDVPNAN